MTDCTCADVHARHISLGPQRPHDPCSVKCPACCEASWTEPLAPVADVVPITDRINHLRALAAENGDTSA